MRSTCCWMSPNKSRGTQFARLAMRLLGPFKGSSGISATRSKTGSNISARAGPVPWRRSDMTAMTNLRKIIIDGAEVEVDSAMTLIQACEVAGIEVPRFCYHERLSIAGNCRMCLVEVVADRQNRQRLARCRCAICAPAPRGRRP